MIILEQYGPILIVLAFGWASWLTKLVIDLKTCNERREQKLDDFISRYDEHLK